MFSQRQEWNKIFVDSHLQVTKSYYVFMVRGRRNKLEKREMLCFFLRRRRERDNLGEVLRGEKDDTPRIVESNMGKECQRNKLEGKSSAVFYHREDKSATTLRKKFFIARGRGGRDHFGKRILFLT